MRLHIHSLEKTIFDGSADVVSLPTETGVISVLAGHTPLVTALKKGNIEIKNGAEIQKFPIDSGFAQINHDSVIDLIN